MDIDAIKYGALQAKLQTPEDGIPYIVIPKDYKRVTMEDVLGNPTRVRESLQFEDFDDFMSYIKMYKTVYSVTFWSRRKIKVVFDYHMKSDGYLWASWCTHKATYVSSAIEQFVESYKENQSELPPIYHAK